MIKIPSQDKEGIMVGCLLFTDMLVAWSLFSTSLLLLVELGEMYIATKFPWTVIWSALDNPQLPQCYDTGYPTRELIVLLVLKVNNVFWPTVCQYQ